MTDEPGSSDNTAGTAGPASTDHELVTLIVGPLGRSRSKRPSDAGAPVTYLCEWSAEGPTGLRSLAPGEMAPEPVLELSISTEDADLVLRGELAPSVAFMQGRLKTAGDNALLLRVLAWTTTSAFAKALASLPAS
ncbi:MAG TPA: SCP2 sterol-binding domain-containing protein [Acidimicrobiales bacterium]|nr:SCP2 sterol-binding domain-containing protein [Acidimicrobiales bacterium]